MYDKHYQGDVEPIELMQAQMTPEAFMGFLRGNIIKYASRCGKKDDAIKETYKIAKYAEWLHKASLGQKVNPHNDKKTSIYEGVYYRKDNPNKPWTARLFKMFKTSREAYRFLRHFRKRYPHLGRVNLHKSSMEKNADKPWELVIQRTFQLEYNAYVERLKWFNWLMKYRG